MEKLRSLFCIICILLIMCGMVWATDEYYKNDATPPYGKIEISEVTKVEGTDKVSVKVQILAKDDRCKDDEIKYYLSTSQISNTTGITEWESYTTNKTETLEVVAGSKIYAVFKDKNGNTSLINKGESLSQTIVYDVGDGTNAPVGANSERLPGMPFVVTSQEPKKEGYYFLGWSIDSQANIASFSAGDIIPADFEIGNSDTAILYAVYTDDETKLPEASEILQISDYVNYPVYYDNVDINGSSTNYEGWRVISIENDGTINLVSAGVPLTYYHGSNPATSVNKLNEGFLTTEFTVQDENTYRKNSFNANEALADIFNNKYTLLDENGKPKVRSIKSEDVLKVINAGNLDVGQDLTNKKYHNLLDIGQVYWLASDYTGDNTSLLAVDAEGIVANYSNAEYGVRPIVSLKPNVKVTGKDKSGAWNIEMPMCKITFDANGGSGMMVENEKEENEEYTLPPCGFTAPTNKEFSHWEVNGETKLPGEKITITSNTMIKAMWLEFNLEVTGINESYEYTGSQITPVPVVKANGISLTKGTDYDVAYGENLNAGTTKGTLTVTYKGKYSGTETKEFTITPKNISSVTMELDIAEYTFDGTAKTPSVTVTDGSLGGLTQGTDYTVAWTNNTKAALSTDANAPTVTITGKDNYTGTKSVTFTIKKAEMVVSASNTSETYDGTAHSAAVSVTTPATGATIYYKEGTELTGANYNTVGSTTVPTRTNVGNSQIYYYIVAENYNAKVGSVNILVNAREITVKPADATKKYDGEALTSNTAKVTSAIQLAEGHKIGTVETNGTVTAVDSVTNEITEITILDASDNDVTANYTITKVPGTLTVTAQDSVTFSVTLSQTTYEYDGTAKTPAVASVKDGTNPVSSSDYDVVWTNNTDAGSGATVTVNGKNNYAGSTGSATFKITEKALTLTAGSKTEEYDGTAVTEANVTYEGLVSNHVLSATTEGSQTNVGSSSNVVKTYSVKSGNTDVTKNYKVTTVNGTLTVTKKTLTVTKGTTTFNYTGSPIKPTATVSGAAAGETINLTITTSPASAINPGTHSATVTIGSVTNGSTSNYTLTGDTSISFTIKARITFKANGGSGTMSNKYATLNSSYTLPACTFTAPSGKEFNGWLVGSTTYAVGSKITISGNTTVTAQWKTSGLVNPEGGTVNILSNSDITNSNLNNNANISMVVQAPGETTQVPVPTGFTYYLGTGDTGLVVKDGSGNEFVWIPVADVTKMYTTGNATSLSHYNPSFSVTTTKWGAGTLATMSKPNSTSYREPAVLVGSGGTSYDAASANYKKAGFTSLENFATDMKNEFNGMIESISNYGGFYVGRYELGYENSEVVCKSGVMSLTAAESSSSDEYGNYAGSSETSTWYGLYKACKGFTQGGVQSSMIWGSQWDVMLNFIGDNALETTPGVRKLTGAYGDEYKHVHETSTGLYDWTAIASNNYRRAVRGGYYGNAYSASYRDVGTPTSNYNFFGTRAQLYIKPDGTGGSESGGETTTEYIVTFEANGGTGSVANATVKEGATYILPDCPFTYTGYSFVGWSVNGGSTQAVGTQVTVTGNMTLTAMWESAGYTDTDSSKTVNILSDSEITNSNLKNNTNISMVLQAEGETTQVPVPTGFTYYLGTGDTGVVVKDASENEFVWIPVNLTAAEETAHPERTLISEMYGTGTYTLVGSTGVKTTKYGKSNVRKSDGSLMYTDWTTPGTTSSYREPDFIDYDTDSRYLSLAGFSTATELATDLATEFNNMITSVEKYGGFYVGRYELGYDSGVVCKPGVTALTASISSGTNYYGSDTTQSWHGLYKASKTFTQGGVTSNMIWGTQWDAMVNFIGDHTATAPSRRYLTGASQYNDKYKNVYDTSTGAVWEWTATAYNTGCRGCHAGDYSYASPASNLYDAVASNTTTGFGTRVQLYIK